MLHFRGHVFILQNQDLLYSEHIKIRLLFWDVRSKLQFVCICYLMLRGSSQPPEYENRRKKFFLFVIYDLRNIFKCVFQLNRDLWILSLGWSLKTSFFKFV